MCITDSKKKCSRDILGGVSGNNLIRSGQEKGDVALKSAGSTAKHVEIPISMTSVTNIVPPRNGHVSRGFILEKCSLWNHANVDKWRRVLS
jgi:hypothetical protein